MIQKNSDTYSVQLYLAGPVDVAKQIIRQVAIEGGLCVTITPTSYIYKGGEEEGYQVGLVNYPKFPESLVGLIKRARSLMKLLLDGTYQSSAMMVTPEFTEWISNREE